MADPAHTARPASPPAAAPPPGVVLAPSGEDRTELLVAWLARLIERRRAGTLTDR